MRASENCANRVEDRARDSVSNSVGLKRFAVVMMVWALATVASARNVDLKPGRYEVTVSYEVQHERQSQSQTTARCIRTQDLGNPEEIFNDRTGPMRKKEEICTVKGFKAVADRISYDADCSNRTVHVEGTVDESSFSIVRMATPKVGQAVPVKLVIRGRRTGDCVFVGEDDANSLRDSRGVFQNTF